jgi:dTDP-4-dehydrorhamnose 3,5-epimerase
MNPVPRAKMTSLAAAHKRPNVRTGVAPRSSVLNVRGSKEQYEPARKTCPNGMIVTQTEIPDLLIIEPKLLGDQRGFFLETFQLERYQSCGIKGPFIQDNLSRSGRGVLRGLHLQNPNTQGKLVSVMRGLVRDVAVDVRVGSPTFGRYVAVELSEENRRQFWVPRGFAHGFVVLSESADFFYKCDAPYSPADELVIRWNDPAIAVDWSIGNPSLSERDASAPLLSQIERLPRYGQT